MYKRAVEADTTCALTHLMYTIDPRLIIPSFEVDYANSFGDAFEAMPRPENYFRQYLVWPIPYG